MNFKLIQDIKLFLLGLALIIFIILSADTAVNIIDNNSVRFISDMYSERVVADFVADLEVLTATAEVVAENAIIIETIKNANANGLGQEDILKFYQEIDSFKNILNRLSFVDTINVVSIKDEFLVTADMVITEFDIMERPWFLEEMWESYVSNLTGTYTDFVTEKEVVSIISYITDPSNDELLGFVVLDMFIDDIIEHLQRSFPIGHTDVYIAHSQGISSSIDAEVNYEHAGNYILEYLDYDKNKILTFSINLDSIKANPYIAKNSQYITWGIIIFTIVMVMAIIVFLKIILTPVVQAINSLTFIVHDLGEENIETKMGLTVIDKLPHILEQNIGKKIEQIVYHDDLTKLPNRKLLRIFINELITSGTPFSMILLDIKEFKSINDTSGEEAGDEVLSEVSRLLARALGSPNNKIIRYAGDEFILLLPGITDAQNLINFYERQIQAYFSESAICVSRKPINVQFSAGAVIYPTHGNNEDELLSKVNVMLRKSKKENLDTIMVFNDEVYKDYTREETIKESLQDAIISNEFTMNYQPIIDEHKKIVKAEALIRWNSGTLGFIAPDYFIGWAEQTRLIIDLGYWIIHRVSQDMKVLYDMGKPLQISINISPIQIMSSDFVDQTLQILDFYDIDYKDICFEITESALLENRTLVKENINRLREVGISLALDDFGTGYSSFSYLKDYNLDIIKLDKIFIDDATDKDYEIVKSINRIARILDMQIVIEGVETEHQFKELKDLGLIQGYYFSRPIIWDEFIKLL
ncbi:MAG: hypothetical protein ATN35_03925 [Epulopiscium sp. Nele67-Bin004]|nr:MAG: hypothetical protein ATN35_03925 [Epulopiscium sp. Nele67-Bin004]